MTENNTKIGMFGGVLTSFFGVLTVNEMLGVIGALVAVGSLILNWWYKREMLRIERRKAFGDVDR